MAKKITITRWVGIALLSFAANSYAQQVVDSGTGTVLSSQCVMTKQESLVAGAAGAAVGGVAGSALGGLFGKTGRAIGGLAGAVGGGLAGDHMGSTKQFQCQMEVSFRDKTYVVNGIYPSSVIQGSQVKVSQLSNQTLIVKQ